MNKYKRRKGHTITPVIYPARITTLVLHEPLKGAKNNNAELVHKDEKKNNHIEPPIGKNFHVTPHPHNKEQEDQYNPDRKAPLSAFSLLFRNPRRLLSVSSPMPRKFLSNIFPEDIFTLSFGIIRFTRTSTARSHRI